MKSRLPKLNSVLTSLVLAMLPCSGLAQPTPATGRTLIREAADSLAQQRSLEARIRQRVAVFGQYLVGSGTYRQLIIGQRKRLRLELTLQVADQITSVLQVSNGTTLWERRSIGAEQTMTYVNLRSVRQALGEERGVTPQPRWIAFGGLDFLLRGLDEAFEFAPPVPQTMGDVPVWEIRGQWKHDKLRDWMGQGGGSEAPIDLSQLADHIPHSVVVTLGRDDLLPLFPYRVEFRRWLGGPTTPNPTLDPASEEPLATIELFEVRHYEVDPRHFEFPLNEQEIDDQTEAYLTRLRQLNPATKPPATQR
jgi:hypothetical protein